MQHKHDCRYCWFALHAGSLLLAVSLCGCGDGLTRATVAGKVTLSGVPLQAGIIRFVPVAPHKGPVASAAIVNGEYKIPKFEGPVAGYHRVEVEADLQLGFSLDDEAAYAARGGAPLPPNPIPPAYNTQSLLTKEVTRGHNEYNLDIPDANNSVAGS